MIWDQVGEETDMDYGLAVLPCQEEMDELKSIKLKIDKEGLTK